MTPLRIISLIPSATEIVYLLGLGDFLVARSHDSNFPPQIQDVPVVTATSVTSDMSSKQIDDKVKSSLHKGVSIFHIDQKKLSEVKPNLVLTQELCEACAPSFTQIKKAARLLTKPVKLLSLEPKSIDDMYQNILLVGAHTRKLKAAQKVVKDLKQRMTDVERKTSGVYRPSVVIIEWLDPIMTAGHWVYEMVDKSGGHLLLSRPYEKSKKVLWHDVSLADPDIIIFAPCGFNVERARQEIELFTTKPNWIRLRAVKNNKVYFVDGDAYLTRSGPRLVDGVEILSKVFHPEIFGEPNLAEASKYV